MDVQVLSVELGLLRGILYSFFLVIVALAGGYLLYKILRDDPGEK